MSFQCPECGESGTIRITQRLELPPDSRSDEITLQTVRCNACRFQAIAVYQESRRGSLDDDAFDHTGYRVHPDDLSNLRGQLRSCPQPGNPRCTCPAHRALRHKSPSGRWDALDSLRLGEPFAMRR